jgi:hypothetical protein
MLVAEGSIMPTIMMDHMRNESRSADAVQGRNIMGSILMGSILPELSTE